MMHKEENTLLSKEQIFHGPEVGTTLLQFKHHSMGVRDSLAVKNACYAIMETGVWIPAPM